MRLPPSSLTPGYNRLCVCSGYGNYVPADDCMAFKPYKLHTEHYRNDTLMPVDYQIFWVHSDFYGRQSPGFFVFEAYWFDQCVRRFAIGSKPEPWQAHDPDPGSLAKTRLWVHTNYTPERDLWPNPPH